MSAPRVGVLVLVLLVASRVAAGVGGDISGYTTLSKSGNTLNSSANVTFVMTTILCTSACSYHMSGDHKIRWSRTGDVVGAWTYHTNANSYRSLNRMATGIPGECFSASSSGKYELLAGTAMGAPIPFLPLLLDEGGPWASTSVCIPNPPPPPPPPPPLEVCDHCDLQMEPLILDLDGDGILTTTKTGNPVWFDLDGNGVLDLTAWTAPGEEDAFLSVDWNRSHTIDGGQELFGDATIMPNGQRARNGYEALTAYDHPVNGGDNNGIITRADAIWSRLQLWVDRNHDGLVSTGEKETLAAAGVIEIPLVFTVFGAEQNYGLDEHLNQHYLQGEYTRRVGGQLVHRAVHEIYFNVDLH